MSGYFAGYSRTDGHDDFDATKQQVEEVHANTGQYPAVVACDYADGWVDGRGSTTVSTYCNGYLKEAWSKGSLPSVSVHAPNPGGGSMNVPLADFSDLTNPATPAGKAWHSTLDRVAAGLKDRTAGRGTTTARATIRAPLTWTSSDWTATSRTR
ncbi:glycosyl hydrolase [Streptomyces sp. NPDC060028]|uniref:glycosyl hydrolase n=1 Tax=Streptomyces sp. NPDC060028 TaxID=3347041 RepID=UPI00368402EB